MDKPEMTWSEELDCFLCLAISMADSKLKSEKSLDAKIPYNMLREDMKKAKSTLRKLTYQLDDYSQTGTFELPIILQWTKKTK